jgi:hypothetical protein
VYVFIFCKITRIKVYPKSKKRTEKAAKRCEGKGKAYDLAAVQSEQVVEEGRVAVSKGGAGAAGMVNGRRKSNETRRQKLQRY